MTSGGAGQSPTVEERVAATRSPAGPHIMRQRWAHLLFLHWPVPVVALRPLVPAGLDLDVHDGVAYVGLIPFTMTGVRPAVTPPIPGLSDFHETNVRTYVHRGGRDPGVWFFSLDAANAVAVRAARALYRLPYYFARMDLRHEADGAIAYSTERLWPEPTPATCAVRYRPIGPSAPAQPGTLEHFLIERYILYSASPGRLFSARVHHAAYPVQRAEAWDLNETMLAAAGIARPEAAPLMHYASEVRVRIWPLWREAA